MVSNPRKCRACDMTGKAQRFRHLDPAEFRNLYGKRPERDLIICQRHAVMHALLVKARGLRPLLKEIRERLAEIHQAALCRAFRDLLRPREGLPLNRVELLFQRKHGRCSACRVLSPPFRQPPMIGKPRRAAGFAEIDSLLRRGRQSNVVR